MSEEISLNNDLGNLEELHSDLEDSSEESSEDSVAGDREYESDDSSSHDMGEEPDFRRRLTQITGVLNYYNSANVSQETKDEIEQNWFPGVEGGTWKIQLGRGPQFGIIEEDDILGHQYWHNFLTALRNHSPDGGLDSILISNINLSIPILEDLLPAIAHLSDVTFSSVPLIRKDGLLYLINFMGENASWTKFQISMSKTDNILDMEIAQCFSDVLKHHSCLRQVNFGCYSLGARPDILCVLLDGIKHVENVSMWHLELTSQGHHMANMLKKNPDLQHLKAGCNLFNDNDAAAFADALKYNTNLKLLALGSQFRRLTSVGGKALLKAVFDGSSLDAVFDSNHTCRVTYDNMDDMQEKVNRLHDINLSRENIIKYKLLMALGAFGGTEQFKIELLKEVQEAVELMPKVLELVQLENDIASLIPNREIVSLTNVFEMMMRCVAPLLSPSFE